MTDAEVMLRLSNVESAYGPIKAIRGVSLRVRRGEIATVLGANARARADPEDHFGHHRSAARHDRLQGRTHRGP